MHFRLVAQANDGERMPAILWTNTMTERGVEKFLPKDDYIVQIWTTGTDESINDVISKGQIISECLFIPLKKFDKILP